MTLTTGQVEDLQTTVKTDLEAGTWTNYASTPKIHVEAQKKNSKNTWVEVLNTSGDVIQAANGAIILFDDQCEININTQNRTDLNKLYADFINILNTTGKGYTYHRTRDRPKRSKYNKNFIVKLKGKR